MIYIYMGIDAVHRVARTAVPKISFGVSTNHGELSLLYYHDTRLTGTLETGNTTPYRLNSYSSTITTTSDVALVVGLKV